MPLKAIGLDPLASRTDTAVETMQEILDMCKTVTLKVMP